MPTASRPHRPRQRRRKKGEDPEIAQLPEDQQAELENPPALAAEPQRFDPFLTDGEDGLPFMDAITMITEREWDGYWLYLYRLDPQVRNAETDSKYIARYQVAMSEDDIRTEHGGGKYMYILRENVSKNLVEERGYRPKERRHKFSIEGTPKFIRGQTVVGQDNTTVLPAREESEGAALARALPELVKTISSQRDKNDPGVSQVAEMIGQAAKGAISIVTESTRQQVTSITGSAFGDKLLDRFLDSSREPQRNKVEDKLIEIALARISNPETSNDGGLGQLTAVKELLGVDSILDLIKGAAGGPGDAWKSKLVDMGAALFTNLPAMLQLYFANQERQYQRALQLRATQPPQPGQPVATEPAVPVIPAAAPSVPPGTQFQPQGGMPMDATSQALVDIVMCYGAGLGGDAAASLIRTKFPQFVTMFIPLLEDRDQVMLFAKNTPPLNAIAGEEDFPGFMDEFIREMLHPEDEEPAGEPQPA